MKSLKSAAIPSTQTLLVVSIIILAVFWNLSNSGSLIQSIGAAYVALAVLVFTLAWMIVLGLGLIWAVRLLARGREAEGLDLIRAAQARMDGR